MQFAPSAKVCVAGQVIVGAWLSVTVTVNEHVVVRPLAAVAKNVLVVVPTGKAEPEGKPAVCVVITLEQLPGVEPTGGV